jgi:hypothetical protein
VVRASLLLLIAVSACTDDSAALKPDKCEGLSYTPNVRTVLLSQFPDTPVAVELQLGSLVADYADREGRSMTVTIRYTDTEFQGAPVPLHDGMDAYCPELDSSFAVTFDGNRVGGQVHGGWACRLGGAVCAYPGVTVPISIDDHTPDSVLTVSDRSRSITIPLGDVLLERSIAPVGQVDWTFHAKQQATFTWSPNADLATAMGVPRAGFYLLPGNYVSDGLAVSTATADSIVVTMPDTSAGTLGISLTSSEINGDAVVTTSQVAFHDVSIVP